MRGEGCASSSIFFCIHAFPLICLKTRGKGLGKDEQGKKDYIRVKKKDDNEGLGAGSEKVAAAGNEWWFNAFDKAAKKVSLALLLWGLDLFSQKYHVMS